MFGVVNQPHGRRVRLRSQFCHQFPRRRVCFVFCVAAKFDQQPAFAFGEDVNVARMNVLELHRVDQHVVDPFEANRFVLANFGDVITRVVNIGITKHKQRAGPGIGN